MTTSDDLVSAFVDALSLSPIVAVTPGPLNIGTGTVQSIRVAPPALIGIYALAFDTAEHFAVNDPTGALLDYGYVGERFDHGGLSFIVMPGNMPFQDGDSFSMQTQYPTAAGAKIYAPKDWPTNPALYPILKIASPEERKESLGPNAPQFNVVTTIRVIGTIQSKPKSGDAGAGAAQAALGVLQGQIERAIINNYALFKIISEIQSVDIKNMVQAQGEQHIGELTMDFAMLFYQGTEDFAPILADPISEIAIYADLLNVFDPEGTYATPFPYDTTAAPRESGPDGRAEAGAIVEVETD